MSQNDPFDSKSSDHTFIVPSPGRRGANQGGSFNVDDLGLGPQGGDDGDAGTPTGINPLVAAANPLLGIVSRLRASTQHPNPSALRDALAKDIKEFERRATAAGVEPQKVIAARYVLCTVIDEMAASTPWGGSGIWAKQSLLLTFHNEMLGGEKVFQLMAKLSENPGANRDILELIYICLSLGFEGRYRVLPNGRAELESLRERLGQLLLKDRRDFERDLSPHWQGVAAKRQRVFYVVPLWVAIVVSLLLLVGAYMGLSFLLNKDSDPVFANISALRVAAPPPVVVPAPAPRLTKFLANEIAAGLVTVRDDNTRSVVTLRGDGLFAPGSATLLPEFEPLLVRIADALTAVPGRVLVTGHTDDQPIQTARFPSNWHLSLERARAVMQLLAVKVPASRLSAEGRADTEPRAANDTPANRARNRRVEIILFVAPPSAAAKPAVAPATTGARAPK